MDANLREALVNLPEVGNLANQLECPICMEVPYGYIFQCERGHSLCNSCKNRVAVCPLCQSRMRNTRNFFMEDLISNSNFICMHEREGCREIVKGGDMKNHLDVCPFRIPNLGLVENAPANPAVEDNNNWVEMGFNLDLVIRMNPIGRVLANAATEIAAMICSIFIVLFIFYLFGWLFYHYSGIFFRFFLPYLSGIIYYLFILTVYITRVICSTILPLLCTIISETINLILSSASQD